MKLLILAALTLTLSVASLASAEDVVELPSDCQVLGVWESSPPWFLSETTICEQPDGTHWIQHELEDGSTRVAQLVPSTGERFHVPEDPNYYYEILPDGRLEFGGGGRGGPTYFAAPIHGLGGSAGKEPPKRAALDGSGP